MDEMLKNLNGPWSNAACMGYCLIAMRRAGLLAARHYPEYDELEPYHVEEIKG